MQHFRLVLACLIVTASALPAMAGGLLDKLPADGSKAVYDMKLTSQRGGQEMSITGTLTVSSVGQEKVDGKTCRWIEVDMTMEFQGMKRSTVAKFLVPESEFGADKDPTANLKKGWLKRGDREPSEIKSGNARSLGPLPVFFPGPLSDAKKLDAAKIKTGLGELECKGTSGKRTVKQETMELKVAYETRTTDKSPFGVASGTMNVTESRDGVERGTTKMEFTLKSVGKDAKSALPDKK